MTSIIDDRGYNQGYRLVPSTEVRMRRRADLILSEMGDGTHGSILEIGCGTGEIAYWMAEKSPAQVLGTDLCAPFIEGARKNFQLPNLRYEVFDFNKPEQFSGERFDYIIGNGILHHLYENLDAALLGLSRLLKDGGKIIFMEPNYHNPYVYLIFTYPSLRKVANLEPDEMAFSKSFIVKKLEKAAFADIRVDYKDFLIPGVPRFLIRPLITLGAVLEKIPLVRHLSQSLFIRAVKKQTP